MRIVTINTGKGDGPYRQRLAWLTEELDRLQPDIVLLQEALANVAGAFATHRFVAHALGMDVAFVPARRKHREVEGEWRETYSGLAVLSHAPIAASGFLPLPADPLDGERVGQIVEFEQDGGSLVIANVHLTHLRARDDLRRQQLATLLRHPWLNKSGTAAVIGGDLNTPLAELDSLLDGQPRRLRDAFPGHVREAKRATIPVGPSLLPRHCVDYVLLADAKDATPLHVSATEVVLNRPDGNGIYPSDHCGVLVDVDVVRSKATRLG